MSLLHRERVLRAATSSFLARGYSSSVDDIARRARVAKQTVYQHFASKEELFHSFRKVQDDGIYICTAFSMRMLKSIGIVNRYL